MANSQMKCGIVYKKIAMWADDDERMINYEWPKVVIFMYKIWLGTAVFKNHLLITSATKQ